MGNGGNDKTVSESCPKIFFSFFSTKHFCFVSPYFYFYIYRCTVRCISYLDWLVIIDSKTLTTSTITHQSSIYTIYRKRQIISSLKHWIFKGIIIYWTTTSLKVLFNQIISIPKSAFIPMLRGAISTHKLSSM